MNTIQENKLNMYYSVRDLHVRFQTTWSVNVVYTAAYNAWLLRIPLIEQNRDAQSVLIKGITADKLSKKMVMIDKANFFINRLQSYANASNNIELLGSVQYSLSEMKRARENSIISICNNISTKANANAVVLLTYGVTAVMLTDFTASILAYSTAFTRPSTAKSQIKGATENLTKYYDEADSLLALRLDLDVELFKVSKPDFYSQYLNARKVSTRSGSVSAILGKVICSETGDALKGVNISIVEADTMLKSSSIVKPKPLMKKTTVLGQIKVSNMAESTYTAVLSKLGYKDQVITFYVINSETTRLHVEMEKV